ncbi:MAG: hypothetical protein QNK23_16865 [Crocinitomicaceae bacterium]|nr:hypothetical protein [Crocinitomicaceae bacterium]
MKRKIIASSIAEVVIAVTVIALCFGIASMIFIRSSKTFSSFQDLRLQTEVQSLLWEQLHGANVSLDIEGVQVVEETDENNESITVVSFISEHNTTIWQQQIVKLGE